MKFYYITNSRLPTEKAFGYGITKMCEAFGRSGRNVELILPKRFGADPKTIFSYYGVEPTFSIRILWALDLFRFERYLGKFAYGIHAVTFFISLCFLKVKKGDWLYSRDLFLLPLLRLKSPSVFLEIHFLQTTQRRLRFFFRYAKKILVTTTYLQKEIATYGFPSDQILVIHDAVDISQFGILVDKIEARQKLALPTDKQLIVYTGNFKAMGQDKGILNVLKALPYVLKKQSNIMFVAVGGTASDISEYKKLSEKFGVAEYVSFLPRVHVRELPLYQSAADALAMCPPNTEYYAHHVSPLKMFEYMASSRPIIASDLPSMREVLDENSAFLVNADDEIKLSQMILNALENQVMAKKLSTNARRVVEEYTWEKRAARALGFLKLN